MGSTHGRNAAVFPHGADTRYAPFLLSASFLFLTVRDTFPGLKRVVAQKPLWAICWYTPEQLGRSVALMASANAEDIHGRNLHCLSISFVASLKSCAEKKDLKEGSRLHSEIRTHALLNTNIYVGNMLISMYAKCGALAQAQQVLNELHVRDVVSWSALIAGFAQNGHGKKTLDCYVRMRCEGLSPDAITFVSILKACGITKDIEKGKEIHKEIVCQCLLGKNVVLESALVDMYAKCGVIVKAQEVFDGLPEQNLISWSALIAGYVRLGQGVEALDCF
ncbi:hypothetical protein L7F22_018884 [Adiantum nelumboides]|nr:hypothetical protein [Adiantum nelumboides]